MARRLVPKKLIINFEDGSFSSGIAMYRIRENGVLEGKCRTLEIKNIEFNKVHLNAILRAVRNHIRNVENAEEE